MVYKGYEIIQVGTIPTPKLRRAAKTGKLSLTAQELKGNRTLIMHPGNAARVKRAQLSGKGVQGIMLSGPEIVADMEYHKMRGAGLSGGSLWDSIKSGVSKVGQWLKDSGIGSVLADTVQDLATPIVGDTIARGARGALREVTGVGFKSRRPVRGGSFMIN